ncbi:hypothetical protein [Clostridium hydrogenum]|uniref:hypothetical protein n=1 Tax=Clostridium hydrogenum TaxID=2855764 RepID=UPI001F1ECE92|nr:hypothetical protein [Clostridium hydrogenum]
MSWYREVKTIYTINLLMILYIVWSIVSIALFGNPIDYKFYLITLIGIFIIEYFLTKKKMKNVGIAISILVALVLLYFSINDMTYVVMNAAYYIFEVFVFVKFAEDSIKYSALRGYIKNSIIVMMFVVIFMHRLDAHQLQSTFRFYVIFLISSVLLLRESRSYSSKVKKRTPLKNNVLISAGMIFFSFDFVLEAIFKIIGLVLKFLGFVFSPLKPLGYKLAVILDSVLNPLMYKLAKGWQNFYKSNPNGKLKIKASQYQKELHNTKSSNGVATTMAIVIGIIILCTIIYVIYRFTRGKKKNIKELKNDVVEEREKIKNDNKNTKSFFSKLTEAFRKKGNVNEEIKFLFGKFQFLTYKKEIFKSYMTATQLTNVTKAHIDESDELDKLSNIYNEAKFSNRLMEKDKFEAMSESFDKVRKKLLDLKENK